MTENPNIYNVVNKLLDPNINLLYNPNNSFFDFIIPLLDCNVCTSKSKNSTNYYYDTYMTSDFFNHSNNRNSFLYKHHINDIVVFNEPCPRQFKKEDKIILSNTIRSAIKIFTNSFISESWLISDNKTYTINYGLPQVVEIPEKTIPVLILNLRNNQHAHRLYNHIKQIFNETKYIYGTQNDFKFITEMIKRTKIVIDIDSPSNLIHATQSGCFTISSQCYDPNIKSCLIMNDFRSIHEVIQDMLGLSDKSIIDYDQQYINKVYNFNNFYEKMNNILYESKMEPFIL